MMPPAHDIGPMCGADAHYGAETIPAAWRDKLTISAEIMSLADHLHDQAGLM